MLTTEIALIQTIPHSGTHFLRDLLELHPKIAPIVWVDMGAKESINLLIEDIYCGIFDLDMVKGIISYHIKDPKKIMHTRITKEIINAGCEYDIIPIFEHLAEPFHQRKTWFRDLIDRTGNTSVEIDKPYKFKVLTTLRDPIKIMITIMLQLGSMEEGRRLEIDNTLNGFNYLLQHKSDPDFYFLPVDLYQNIDKNRRIGEVDRLFKFLNLDTTPEILEYAEAWSPKHVTAKHEENKVYEFDLAIIQNILEAKKKMNEGEKYIGISELVDREVVRFSEFEELKELYKKYGYQDLAWF